MTDDDELLRKIDETIPAECAHCGEQMFWIDDLHLVHVSTGSTYCPKVSVSDGDAE